MLESKHETGGEPVPVRVLGAEPDCLIDHTAVISESQQGIQPILDGAQPRLREMAAEQGSGCLVRGADQRGTTPEAQSVVQQRNASLVVAGIADASEQVGEPVEVDTKGLAVEDITRRLALARRQRIGWRRPCPAWTVVG
jgi:hypothetical protein